MADKRGTHSAICYYFIVLYPRCANWRVKSIFGVIGQDLHLSLGQGEAEQVE
ncbi:hypothetical protein W04_0963 [Pseudoalteromonas sp. SW0106-04]|nr:hypothetical protein W04_0963 [Pseudoalteromonas sp. SW0106-04]